MNHIEQRWNATAAWRRIRRWTCAGGRVLWIAFNSAVLMFSGGSASAATYYVAKNGSDAAAGTIGAPFATLEKARDTIRAAGPFPNGVTVFVRGGNYYRSNTFALTSQDSGASMSAPIVYLAYTNETPVLVGGLPVTNWTTWQGNILQASVNTQGLSGVTFRQLFFNSSRQINARFPNYVSTDPFGSGWSYVASGGSSSSFTYAAGDVHTWAKPTAAEVFIYPRYNWWNDIVGISAINTNSHVISLSGSTSYSIATGDRYYVQNVFEELDSVGEWYLNNSTGILYFWPPSSVATNQVWVPTIRTMVSFGNGTSNVTFQGFSLSCCEGTAITLSGTTRCLVAKNTITGVGDYDGSGVDVANGKNNGVVGNDISYVGRHGIQITGGTTTTLTPAGNYADNNYIHHVGVSYKEGSGIHLYGVGNRASHNLIHDGPRFAMYFRGQNLTIEYNEMRNVMQETDDGGVIYSENTNWLEDRGCVIRYNYLHHATGWGFESGTGGTRTANPWCCYGIYLDALTCGVDIVGNIISSISGPGLFINGGSENRVTNNIIYECTHGGASTGNQQVNLVGYPSNMADWTGRVDAFISGWESITNQAAWTGVRGMNVSPASLPYGSGGYTMASNFLFKNIISYTDAAASDISYYVLRMEFDRNKLDYNTLYNNGQPIDMTHVPNYYMSLATWQSRGLDVHSIAADPLFVDAAAGNFLLATNSPALGVGFVQIPIADIGPYPDALRASWPPGVVSGGGNDVKLPSPPQGLRIIATE